MSHSSLFSKYLPMDKKLFSIKQTFLKSDIRPAATLPLPVRKGYLHRNPCGKTDTLPLPVWKTGCKALFNTKNIIHAILRNPQAAHVSRCYTISQCRRNTIPCPYPKARHRCSPYTKTFRIRHTRENTNTVSPVSKAAFPS